MLRSDLGVVTRQPLGVALAFFVAMLCMTSLVHAQATNSGDIRGVVTDTSKAVVPGASVTVRDVNTGFTKVLTTNSSGLYDTASILPGTYTVTVSKTGFKTFVRSNLIVQAGTPLTVNATLVVGATTQTVQVTSQSPLLKTENAAQGTSLQGNVMTELPNVTRSWTNFMSLIPGAVTAAPYASAYSINLNGTMPDYADFLSDGASVTVPHGTNMNATDAFASIAEVQVSTSTYSAEYGNGGVVINQITKSGTNKWHGSLYDFEQNTSLNARSFYSQGVSIEHYHNFGGTVGGPIKHDKAFFFLNVDKLINENNGTGFYTVPTVGERNGDFSETDPSGNHLFPQLYNPNGAGAGLRQPFCGGGYLICGVTLDPLAQKVQQYFPKPNLFYSNGQPLVSNNYIDTINYSSPRLTVFGRVDYDLTNRNRVTISSQRDSEPQIIPSIYNPIDSYSFNVLTYQAQISDVWTISPSVVNEARIGFVRGVTGVASADFGQNLPQTLGWNYAKGNLFPEVNIGGSPGYSIGTNVNDSLYAQYAWTPSDTVTMIRGRHIIHFGGEDLYFQDNDTPWGFINPGNFTFSGVYTSQQAGSNVGGLGYADFLLGDVQNWSAWNYPINGMRQQNPEFFIQDDFKVTPHLTVNLGVRYQIQTGWREKHNNLGSFDRNIVNPVTGTLGAMWFAPQDGRTALEKTVWDVFLPRLGFAWNFKPSWVVRGGFGVYSYLWSEDFYGNGAGVGNSSTGSMSDTSNYQPVFTFSNPNPPLDYIHASREPGAYNGQNVLYTPYYAPVPRSYQWSMEFEKEFPHNMIASVKYVGNHTKGLPWMADINQVPESKLAKEASQNPSTWYLNRPYPQYASIEMGNAPISNTYLTSISNYNALQLDWRKRFSRGLTFGDSFTWEKMLNQQDSSGWCCQFGSYWWQNAYDPAANYGPSENDRRLLTSGYVVYQLPVGHGKRFVNVRGPADWVLGGWQLSSMYYWESGDHFTPIMGTANNSGSLAGYWYPNLVGNPNVANPTLNEWFNPAAFAEPAPFTFGNSGRNILVGPSQSRIDFSIGKSFGVSELGEDGQFQIRLDATNIINHPSFSDPGASIGPPSNPAASGAGQITNTTVGGRVIQLGARLTF